MSNFQSTKVIELGSCAFRQPNAIDTRCSLLHGYKLTAKFWFDCNELDNKNWVVNFGGLKELKARLQEQFDHTTCLAADDPLLPLFKQLHDAGGCDLRIMSNGVGIERTAEFCYTLADKMIREQTNNRCWVSKVEVFEHEANSAIYAPVIPFNKEADFIQTVNNQPELVAEPIPATLNVARSSNSVPASITNPVTHGKGNWFAGTTWE